MPPSRPSAYDKQQDQKDQQQDQQIQNLQNQLTGVETDVVPQGDQPSTLQRLRIHIPNPYTHFLLGQHVTSDPAFGYSGVSLQTDEHFFADIKKKSVFQSENFVLMQTKDNWQQVSEKLMELSSPAAVKVVGGQVFLGAIEEPSAPEFNPNNGEEPEAVAPNNLQPLFDQVLKSSSTWANVAEALEAIHSTVFLTLPDPNLASWLPFLESLYGLGKTAYERLAGSEEEAEPAGNVSIYGQTGVSVLTPAKFMLVAEEDVKSMSGGNTGITAVKYATMQAGIGAKCIGGFKASVEAGLYAEVKAASTVGVSSLRGKLEAKGKVVEIGAHAPNLAQVATKEIELKATEEIKLDSKEDVHLESGRHTHVESKKDIKVEAKEAVHIQVGSYCIEIKTDAIKIGKGSDGTPSDPIITIKGSNIILHSGSMDLKVGKSAINVGNRSTYVNVLDSGNVLVKGSLIKLG